MIQGGGQGRHEEGARGGQLQAAPLCLHYYYYYYYCYYYYYRYFTTTIFITILLVLLLVLLLLLLIITIIISIISITLISPLPRPSFAAEPPSPFCKVWELGGATRLTLLVYCGLIRFLRHYLSHAANLIH